MNAPLWQSWDSEFVWHPYTQMQLVPDAVPVERAQGSYLFLSDGRTIFDGISSWWVTLHGHAQPKIAAAIGEQAAKMEQVIFAGFTHEPAATLAKRLVERMPRGLAKLFLSDNGSTAVEVALKMSLQYWQLRGETRTTFLALEDAYHGDTFGAMAASARSAFTAAFDPLLFDVVRLPFPTPPVEGSEYSDAEHRFLNDLRRHCKLSKPAAFIFEPLLLGAGGMRMWRAEVLREAVTIAREAGVLTIADEVLTGFGRTGTFVASEQADVSPDMMTLSKGITGGFLPLGATLCTREIFDAFLSDDRKKTFFHGHSYTGNPISCAAAVASLDVFDSEPVFDRIATISAVHAERIRDLAAKLGYGSRILGTVAVMEPTNAEGYLSMSSLDLSKRALADGLLIRPLGDTIYFLPPYSTSAEDMHMAYDVLERLLTTTSF